MKTPSKIVAACAATLLSLSMASAFAASSTTMNVTGKVTSGSCTTDGSTLDVNLGNITPTQFSTIVLGSSKIQLNVTCSAPTAIAVKTHDNQSAGKPTTNLAFDFNGTTALIDPDNYYGLTDKSTGNNIGGYALGFYGAIIDGGAASGGSTANLAVSADGKVWAKGNNSMLLRFLVSNQQPYVMPSNADTPVAIPGTTFQFPIDFSATAVKDRLPSNLQNVAIDGSATFEIIYL